MTKNSRSGFTMVEIMIVVAVIGMLMAGTFKLISAAGESNKKSLTVARLQCLQNALSGYYAEYGSYPNVQAYSNTDPYKEMVGSSANAGSETSWRNVSSLTANNSTRAAGAYSTRFGFPSKKHYESYIQEVFGGSYRSVNQSLGGNVLSAYKWDDVKLFRFGLLSFLLPRVEIIFGADAAERGSFGNDAPDQKVANSQQWIRNNPGTLKSARNRENAACSRWLPNLEKCLAGIDTLFNIRLLEPDGDSSPQWDTGDDGGKFNPLLQCIRIRDGWGRDMFYYSPPPYQSYRVWSAGADGCTFPPWISLDTLKKRKSGTDAKNAQSWMKDDIVRFDR